MKQVDEVNKCSVAPPPPPLRDYPTKYYAGRLCPKVQPLTLLYTFSTEKVPFRTPSIEKRIPFNILI